MRRLSTSAAAAVTAVFQWFLVSPVEAQVVHDPSYTLSVELSDLLNPQTVDVDPLGRVYLADSGRGRILRATPQADGSLGSWSSVIENIPVSEFFGLELGPLAVHISSDGSLWYGEGGRETGVEQIHRHTLDGSLVQSLTPAALGGNWSGIAVDPTSGRLYASSANTDRIFISDPTAGAYGPLVEIASTTSNGLISPTGLLLSGGVLYAGFYGPWNVEGQIATYAAADGTLLNPAFSTGMPGLTAIDILGDGRLLATQYGNEEGQGALWTIDPTTGEKTMLVSGMTASAGVAVAPDGATIYVVDMGSANAAQGRLLKLTLVPAPGAALIASAGIAMAASRRRRLTAR